MSEGSIASPAGAPDYRPYRRFMGWTVLSVVTLGSVYLLTGIGVTIYERRHPAPFGAPVGETATAAQLDVCESDLWEVTHGLEKHLESFHTLLDHYDKEEAQRWEDEGVVWRRQLQAVHKRCRFDEVRGGRASKELDAMREVHRELDETEAIYRRQLLTFGRQLAPRLDDVRKKLQQIGERLAKAQESQTQQEEKRQEER